MLFVFEKTDIPPTGAVRVQPQYEYLLYQIALATSYSSLTDHLAEESNSAFGKSFRTGFSARKKNLSQDEDVIVNVKMRWEDYLQIYNFVNRNDVTQRGADQLLEMIRDINTRHKVMVPLPLNFKTILRCLENKGDFVKGNHCLDSTNVV